MIGLRAGAGSKKASGTGRWPWLRLAPVDCLLLLVAVIWGGSYSATKLATAQIPVLQFLVLRFGLTFVILLPALRGLSSVASWPTALAGASMLGLILLAVFVCETFGVSFTTASNAAFLISLCVAFTPLCEWWLLKTRPTGIVLASAVVSLLGASLLAFQHGWSTSLAWGDALMVLAAFLRGVMVCLTRSQGKRHGLPALTVTAVQMGMMTLGSAILMLTVHGTEWPRLPHGASFWLVMSFLVLFCTLFAFFVQNYAAARSSPSRVALLMGSEPMWGALIAVLWMGEQMALQGWVGGLLIVVSASWVTRSEERKKVCVT